jgi:hypothetical protein
MPSATLASAAEREFLAMVKIGRDGRTVDIDRRDMLDLLQLDRRTDRGPAQRLLPAATGAILRQRQRLPRLRPFRRRPQPPTRIRRQTRRGRTAHRAPQGPASGPLQRTDERHQHLAGTNTLPRSAACASRSTSGRTKTTTQASSAARASATAPATRPQTPSRPPSPPSRASHDRRADPGASPCPPAPRRPRQTPSRHRPRGHRDPATHPPRAARRAAGRCASRKNGNTNPVRIDR